MTSNTQTRRTPRPDLPASGQDAPKPETSFDREWHLPQRGARPRTGPVAHGQLNQNGPVPLQEALWKRMEGLDGVRTGHSGISAPTTRALHLAPALALGPSSAFIVSTEFAHLHGPHDGSLHVTLPEALVDIAIRLGWGELHPAARAGLRPPTLAMLYSPRDAGELKTVWRLVQASYTFARGDQDSGPPTRQHSTSTTHAENEAVSGHEHLGQEETSS